VREGTTIEGCDSITHIKEVTAQQLVVHDELLFLRAINIMKPHDVAIPRLVVSFIGAVILLAIVNLVRRGTVR